jgi:predicted SAM-dependent methyltransferase
MIAPVDAPAHSRADRFLAWAATLGAPSPPRRSGLRGRLAGLVPPALRPRLRLAATRALRPLANRRAARLATAARGDGQAPLRLHIGCGALYKEGWVNVDLAGTRVDLPWDLSRPLPFPPASVDAIFHEHLLEHLSYAEGVELHRHCLELLRPGGVLRIGVPDAGAALQAYAMAGGGDSGQWPTAMARVASLTYDSGHRAIYDAETLELSCLAAGFTRAGQCEFGEGDLQPNADSGERHGYTLYVEATA